MPTSLAHGQRGRLQLGCTPSLTSTFWTWVRTVLKRRGSRHRRCGGWSSAVEQGQDLALALRQAAQQQLGVVVPLGTVRGLVGWPTRPAD